MVGGIKGVSMVEVVRKVMMAIDISIITNAVVDVAISDLSQYYDNIPQDTHPEVSKTIGLGTKEELQRHTEGYSAVVPLGEHETLPMPMGKGVLQASVQGVHAAVTAAIPITGLMRDCYGAATAEPMGVPSQMWADDTVVILQRDLWYPLEVTLVDQQAYFEGVMIVAPAVKKMQYATTGNP